MNKETNMGNNKAIMVPASTFARRLSYAEWEHGTRDSSTEWIDELFELLDQQDERNGDSLTQYRVNWEPRTIGDWTLERDEIPKRCWSRIAHITTGDKPTLDRDCGWGPVTMLKHKGEVWMSDTNAEILEHAPLLNKMWWNQSVGFSVVINGLGLGMAVKAALLHNAERVDVIEIDKDVIDIIGPNFASDDRVHIHHADAYEWKAPRGMTWTFAWHDIWQTISADNVEGMDRLRSKYKHRVQWQDCWQRKGSLHMRKNEAEFRAALEAGDWKTVKRLDPDF